ncbi:MAG: YceH family protein [Bryobacteraceae bacterium]|nr:YceH family protein [Bryobacteraceae bacterium]
MPFDLDANEARVLGCLVEKEMATPDYYPLSLNALINACNQKSSRDPLMSLTEDAVTLALDKLRHRGMALVFTGRDSRVPKHGHRLVERLEVGNRELAVLACLLLRGPQTLGEIRSRTQSLYDFEDTESVEGVLRKLAERADPLTKPVSNRWAHLLSGDVIAFAPAAPVLASGGPDRVAKLEEQIDSLTSRLAALEAEMASFRKQFE